MFIVESSAPGRVCGSSRLPVFFENVYIPFGKAGEEISTVNLRLKHETSTVFLFPKLKVLVMFTALSPGCLFGLSGKILS